MEIFPRETVYNIDMENQIIILDQVSIIKHISELDDRLNNDEEYRKKQYRKYARKGKYKTDKNYRVISGIIENETNFKGFGKVTVWRILKLKRENREYFEKVVEGEMSVKTAYNRAFPPKKKVLTEEEAAEKEQMKYKEENIIPILEKLLKDMEEDNFEVMTSKKLEKISNILYKIEKADNKLYRKYLDIEEQWI